MFFETVGLVVCTCVLLGLAAAMGLIALVNYRFLHTPVWGMLDRLGWLAVAAAPLVVLGCIIAAWAAQLGGNSAGAAGSLVLALMWVLMAGVVFFRGLGRPQVRVWSQRQQQSSAPPDVIILPSLPPDDKRPPGQL